MCTHKFKMNQVIYLNSLIIEIYQDNFINEVKNSIKNKYNYKTLHFKLLTQKKKE